MLNKNQETWYEPEKGAKKVLGSETVHGYRLLQKLVQFVQRSLQAFVLITSSLSFVNLF